MNFRGFATVLFGEVADKYGSYLDIVKNTLPKTNIKIPFRTYVSMMLLFVLIIYFASFVTIIIVMQIIKTAILLEIAYVIFVPIIVSVIAVLMFVFYPLQKASAIRKNIESNLPFVLTHMGAIAESGIPPYVIFKLISQFEEYGEVSKEMSKIVRNIDTFGIDPLTAVKDVAEKSASDEFKEVLMGFITTTESGGSVKVFLKSAGEQALFEWRIKRQKFVEQLSAYAEFYTGILIAAPLFIIALFSVMNQIQPNMYGYNILDLMKISIYVIIPVVNVAFMMFLRGVEVET
jgi:archaellum biogenesis protein FlaJ (TadC family)